MWPEMVPPISGHHDTPFGADDRHAPLKAAPSWPHFRTQGPFANLFEDCPMPDIVKDTRYLRTKEAAHYVGLSARTLEKHRTYGTGPAYRKVGGRVLYSIEDLRAWADRGACTSTSDLNNHAVPPAVRRDADTASAGEG